TLSRGERGVDVPPRPVGEAARRAGEGTRGIIVCGPTNEADLAPAVAELARRLGGPVMADPLSGVRCGEAQRGVGLDAFDAFLRDGDAVARLEPEVVLRFGDMPRSKPVLQYLERYASARLIVVDDDTWKEPTQIASDVIQANARQFCEALAAALPKPA